MDDMRLEKTKADEVTAKTNTERKITYNTSKIHDVYANVVKLSAGREEIILQFGIKQSPDFSKREAEVRSIASITLNPFAAKRLALLLNNSLQDYEAQYGLLETEVRQAVDSIPGSLSYRDLSEPERTDEKAGLLFSGKAPDQPIMQILEIPSHPFFMGTQAHPCLTSRPTKPQPMFVALVAAAMKKHYPTEQLPQGIETVRRICAENL